METSKKETEVEKVRRLLKSSKWAPIIDHDDINSGKSNGVGSRLGGARRFSYFSIMQYSTKPNNIDDTEIIIDDKLIEEFRNSKPASNNGKILGFYIIKENDFNQNRPIRNDIRQVLNKLKCVNCGSGTSIVVDHKNDLYNDDRVLQETSQSIHDFQPLCTSCNLRKRANNTNEKDSSELFKYKDIPKNESYGIFPWERQFFDINHLYGKYTKEYSYWYDPKAFEERKSSFLEYKQINIFMRNELFSKVPLIS